MATGRQVRAGSFYCSEREMPAPRGSLTSGLTERPSFVTFSGDRPGGASILPIGRDKMQARGRCIKPYT